VWPSLRDDSYEEHLQQVQLHVQEYLPVAVKKEFESLTLSTLDE
jgi:hypothetical protein